MSLELYSMLFNHPQVLSKFTQYNLLLYLQFLIELWLIAVVFIVLLVWY